MREVECWGFLGLLLVATMASDKNLHLHVCFVVDLGSQPKIMCLPVKKCKVQNIGLSDAVFVIRSV